MADDMRPQDAGADPESVRPDAEDPTAPLTAAEGDHRPENDPGAGAVGHPLSAAGLWDDERPPRMMRVSDDDSDAANDRPGATPDRAPGGTATSDADTGDSTDDGDRSEQRGKVHAPDARSARGAAVAGLPRQRDPVRATIRGVGQVLITAGVVVLLFVVYELWITNIFGEHRQAAATSRLDKLWATEQVVVTQPGAAVVTESDNPVVTVPVAASSQTGARSRHYDTAEGVGFAKLYVPSFGADFVFTIIEGTNENDLYAGPGHYIGTQYPGEPGNFAMAGHRVNKGAPFNDLGLLHSCDSIVVETVDSWYVYRVLPMPDEVASWSSTSHQHCDGVNVQTGKYTGVYGREITAPSDYQQVLPVPHVNSAAVPTDAEKLITLTTCNPKFSDAQRMIIHGVLVKTYAKDGSFLPPELAETT
jgi:sortase (surface protein transpeptidase)